MNLLEFIESDYRNLWIREPGLEYYVRKSIMFPGVVELANCAEIQDGTVAAFYRFLKRYANTIPFAAEQVINEDLAAYFRKLGWRERYIGPIPQYASPLMVERFSGNEWFEKLYDAANSAPQGFGFDLIEATGTS